jgi:outer membrane biosynthesis protein TonB
MRGGGRLQNTQNSRAVAGAPILGQLRESARTYGASNDASSGWQPPHAARRAHVVQFSCQTAVTSDAAAAAAAAAQTPPFPPNSILASNITHNKQTNKPKQNKPKQNKQNKTNKTKQTKQKQKQKQKQNKNKTKTKQTAATCTRRPARATEATRR